MYDMCLILKPFVNNQPRISCFGLLHVEILRPMQNYLNNIISATTTGLINMKQYSRSVLTFCLKIYTAYQQSK